MACEGFFLACRRLQSLGLEVEDASYLALSFRGGRDKYLKGLSSSVLLKGI